MKRLTTRWLAAGAIMIVGMLTPVLEGIAQQIRTNLAPYMVRPENPVTLALFQGNNPSAVIDRGRARVTGDGVSYDGDGSIKLEANEPVEVTLFEAGPFEFGERVIQFYTTLRAENVGSQVIVRASYGEPGNVIYYGDTVVEPGSRSFDWIINVNEIELFNQEVTPQKFRVSVEFDGGTVWIDNIYVVDTGVTPVNPNY